MYPARLLLILGLTATLAVSVAGCDLNKDSPVDKSPTIAERPDTQPGDDPLADDLPPLIRQHLSVDFKDEDWVDEVDQIEQDASTLTVQMGLDYKGNQEAFLEACTAVAGFAMTPDRFGVREVVFEEKDGSKVLLADSRPQCFPIAS
jgi:hypothetical protein